jgi:OOP family OmpA-OmpF porin
MYRAFAHAGADLASTTGQIAVIVLSDGGSDTSPIPEVQALKAQYGERLCIYSVWVGNDDQHEGHNLMRRVADAGQCGFVTQAATIASPAGMADFVTQVFLKPAEGPKDTDGDGVYDHEDRCPNTPKGATVNKFGCWIIKGINFDTDKSNIKSRYHTLLNNVIKVIKNNPGLNVEVQGHTDSQGSASYNLGLSDRRANSVMKYFISHGVSAGRLSANGYGLSRPIYSNSTATGRAGNRRVELKPH